MKNWKLFSNMKVTRNALMNAARAHEHVVQAELLGNR
ncbi:Uncharacterised protein [Trueperella bialowiezensis]|uniref:Uncharacterized protein n=1 Tax=Trueperella bialowiezensis TaxID=312285 RepID=A0A448PDN8_9ACTO|nr:Uncharacterised protein [Trueperella bialowiezensis]